MTSIYIAITLILLISIAFYLIHKKSQPNTLQEELIPFYNTTDILLQQNPNAQEGIDYIPVSNSKPKSWFTQIIVWVLIILLTITHFSEFLVKIYAFYISCLFSYASTPLGWKNVFSALLPVLVLLVPVLIIVLYLLKKGWKS